jgi:hypothetical protein
MKHLRRQLSFALGHDAGHRRVSGDVHARPHHVEEPIDADDEPDTLHRQVHLLQHHGEHDEPYARNARGSDGGQGGGEHHGQVVGTAELDPVGLGDEARGHPLHDRMVAPSGIVKEATELLTPSRSSTVSSVTGRVALLLAVLKAKLKGARILRRKIRGFKPDKLLSRVG